MKVKIGEIVNVYPLIMKSSFEKMSGKAKYQMIQMPVREMIAPTL